MSVEVNKDIPKRKKAYLEAIFKSSVNTEELDLSDKYYLTTSCWW